MLIVTTFLAIVELCYFVIARKYRILDEPNKRSSHNYVTIRGGGIIFPIAACIGLLMYTNQYFLITGTVLISIVSFVDDLYNINSRIRLVIHGVSVLLIVYPHYSSMSPYLIISIIILVTGVINAFNFMDGINGITVLYSGTILATMYWINYFDASIQPNNLYHILFAALGVFAFYNFRKIAKCFAGDVGSISMAFILCSLLLQIIIHTEWPYWLILFGIYGIDTLFTLVCRIIRKENLMEAHRTHFYQFLVNEARFSHLQVSTLYSTFQLVINIILVYSYKNSLEWLPVIILFLFLIIYSIFRFRLEGSRRLFDSYNPD